MIVRLPFPENAILPIEAVEYPHFGRGVQSYQRRPWRRHGRHRRIFERRTGINRYLLLTESASAWQAAWAVISDLLVSGKVKPVVAKVFALEDAADGLRYLIEEHPFGRVVLKI